MATTLSSSSSAVVNSSRVRKASSKIINKKKSNLSMKLSSLMKKEERKLFGIESQSHQRPITSTVKPEAEDDQISCRATVEESNMPREDLIMQKSRYFLSVMGKDGEKFQNVNEIEFEEKKVTFAKDPVPDNLAHRLDILFVGINPGLASAAHGHHYAGKTNHFWPCLYESGLVPYRMTHLDDINCPQFGIGFTNLVARASRTSVELQRCEMLAGIPSVKEKITACQPLIVCFNGKGIYEIFSGSKCQIGLQSPLPNVKSELRVSPLYFVLPSSSGRVSAYQKSDKLVLFRQIKGILDRLKEIESTK